MYEVEITHIFLIFTKAVPDEQVALLKKILAQQADIRLTLKWIDGVESMELSGSMDAVVQVDTVENRYPVDPTESVNEENVAGKSVADSAIDTVNKAEISDLWMTMDMHLADFCITDIPEFCRMAAIEQIPSLLFLHEGNKNAPMQQIPYAAMDFEGIDYAYLRDIYKRFFHIPWTILETERCVLREMTPEDLDALYEVYADPEISRYTENLYEDREQELAYIEDYIEHVYRFCGLGIWVIVEKQMNRLIGRSGLAFRDGDDTPEIGFIIGKEYQRKGYAYEVCRAILKYCKDLDMKTIRVVYQRENLASVELCKKLGFVITGAFTEDGKDMVTGEITI